MKRKLYQAYLNRIEGALSHPELALKSFSSREFSETNMNSGQANDLTPNIGLENLKALLGKTNKTKVSYGDHPDFAYLRTATTPKEEHYIVSVFLDVKNSTSFFKKYNPDQIALIIQTIQVAAIHTCSLFDGHIQRLQYDGVFVYFGGKGISKEKAIKNAINATSFFLYFIKYELKDIFGENGLDQIYARVGIDFGDDSEVTWYVFGLDGCSEVTTVSLHTSLAPKMQSKAGSNETVVGNNVIKFARSLEPYMDHIRLSNGNVDEDNRYIFRDPLYSQFTFNWKKYLVDTYTFVKNDGSDIYIEYQENLPSQEVSRRQGLDNKINLINSGSAYISTQGVINPSSGVKTGNTNFYAEDE